MALVLADRVQQTGTANTTVSFTLSGSVTGFQSFSVIGNTNTTYYSATDAYGNWETGLGTYSTTGPTLTRTTIYQSSNSNAAVTFVGAVNVFVTYPSGQSVNLNASSNLVLTNNATINGVSVGKGAGSGSGNTAVGESALSTNVTGSSNTAVGYLAGVANTGDQNVYIGRAAGINCTGSGNLLVGGGAGYNLTSGSLNTFIGGANPTVALSSGYYVTTGSKNVILGGYAGLNGTLDIRTADNYIVISDGDRNVREVWNNSGALGVGGPNYGTANQVLTSSGSSAAPTWAAVSASNITTGTLPSARLPAGTVLQVVQTLKTDTQVFNAGTAPSTTFYEISNLTLSITPISTSSKILLIASVSVGQAGDAYQASISLVRDGSTRIGNGTSGYASYGTGAAWRAFSDNACNSLPLAFLDSPSTTSATTYGVWMNNNGGSAYASYVNRTASAGGWFGNLSSSLIAMEIAG